MGDSKIIQANSELEASLRDTLDRDPEIGSSQISIAVDVETQQVFLSGMVKNEAVKQRTIELVRRTRPTLIIIDRLKVEPAPDKFKWRPGRPRTHNANNYPPLGFVLDITHTS